ncbi:MAG: hypothetical protein PVH17_09110 [Anaerolineae bacterium]|jgi:uncharacterized YccA/Bax inhibitor family protein
MNTWLKSMNGALTLSVLALLSLLGRTFLDYRYVFAEDFPSYGPGSVGLATLFFVAFAGGWIWALLAAADGRRGAWIALLVFALLTGLGLGAASILAFWPPMQSATPLGEISLLSSLLFGLLAALAAWLQLAPRAAQTGRRGEVIR